MQQKLLEMVLGSLEGQKSRWMWNGRLTEMQSVSAVEKCCHLSFKREGTGGLAIGFSLQKVIFKEHNTSSTDCRQPTADCHSSFPSNGKAQVD